MARRFLVTVGLACLLPWRRVRPLLVFVLSFGTVSAIETLSLLRDVEWEGLDTSAFLLVLPCALARWGSGRDVGIGLLVMAVPLGLSGVAGDPVGNIVGGALVVLLAFAVGFAVRYAGELRAVEVAGLRSRERAELAASSTTPWPTVSAIAVQAQAGRVVAATRPEAAVEALGVIEEEATRALEEMRSMVGALRQGDQADLRPQQGIRDLSRLERHGGRRVPAWR